MTYAMLDLFCGLGGASQAMHQLGWRVVSVDIEEFVKPTVVADVYALPLSPFPVDLLWASPPCTEFSRLDQPWFSHAVAPSLKAYEAARAAIAVWEPRWWVIENVRGAIPYFGRHQYRLGSHYLWTNLPCLPSVPIYAKKGNVSRTKLRPWLRAKVDYEISEAVCRTIEALGECVNCPAKGVSA